MKKLALISSVVMLLSACSTTPYAPTYQVVAKVMEVKKAPEVCYYKPNHDASNRVGKSLIGGLIGGSLGHQFGKGTGKKLMTVVGAATGYVLATDVSPRERSKMTCRSDGYMMRVSYIHPETQQFTTEWMPTKNRVWNKEVSIPVQGRVITSVQR